MDSAEEVASGFVVTGGDGAVLLEFGKEVFDEVAVFVEISVILPLHFAVGFWRDDGLALFGLQAIENPLLRIVGFIGQDIVRIDVLQQGVGSFQVVGLPGRQMKARRIAQGVTTRVNLGAQSALAASNALVRSFFF